MLLQALMNSSVLASRRDGRRMYQQLAPGVAPGFTAAMCSFLHSSSELAHLMGLFVANLIHHLLRSRGAVGPASSTTAASGTPAYNPALDFLSASFDALKALLTPGLQPPNPKACTHTQICTSCCSPEVPKNLQPAPYVIAVRSCHRAGLVPCITTAPH